MVTGSSEQGIAARGVVPLRTGQKFAYGLGGALDYANMNMLQMLATPIFVAQLGVSPAFIGMVFFAQRIWDGITDPVMAHITDNHASRMGRRRGFVLWGGLATALCFGAVWFFPHGWTADRYEIYFAITAFFFMTAHTVFAVPYGALGCEMTHDFDERTRVMGWRVSIGHLGFLYGIWIFFMVEMGKNRGWFGHTSEGLRWVVGIFCVLLATAAVTCALRTRERFPVHTATKAQSPGILRTLGVVLRHRPYLLLIVAGLFTTFSQILVANLQGLLNIFYISRGSLFSGALFAALFGSAIMLSSMATIPFFNGLSRRFGKRNTLIACVALQMVGAALKWFLFNPDLPYLQIIVALLQGPGIAGSTVLIASMVTDICDLDELESGRRREGMFVAVNTWIVKLAGAAAVLLGGYVVTLLGYVPGAPVQDQGVMISMKAVFAFVPAIGSLLAILAILPYALDRKRVQEIRSAIDARAEAGPQ